MLTNRLDLSHAPCKVSPLCTSFLLKLNFDFVTIHNVLLFILSKWPSFDYLTNILRRWKEEMGTSLSPNWLQHQSHEDLPRLSLPHSLWSSPKFSFKIVKEREKSARSFFPQVGTRQMIFCHGRTLSPPDPRSEGTISIWKKRFLRRFSLVSLLGDIDQTHFVVFCIKTHSFYRFHMLRRIQKLCLN